MIVNTALEMPLAKFASITMIEVNKASISESSFDGSVQIQSFPGEYWMAGLQFPKFERTKGEIVSAFLSKLRGPAGSFLLPDTSNPLPRGTAATVSSSPTLNGGGQIGSRPSTSRAQPSRKPAGCSPAISFRSALRIAPTFTKSWTMSTPMPAVLPASTSGPASASPTSMAMPSSPKIPRACSF